MPEGSKKFHEFSLKSALFKGRPDWYFCYLKSERLAHVLALLAAGQARLGELAHRAAEMPHTMAYLAAGEVETGAALADIFTQLAGLRIAATEGLLHQETAALLCREYEEVAHRITAGSNPSPFVAPEDLRVAPLPELGFAAQPLLKDITDTNRMSVKVSDKTVTERMSLILEFIQKSKKASIKDIAAVVKGCSEKTIQRELLELIKRGLIRKMGERRWSVYLPA